MKDFYLNPDISTCFLLGLTGCGKSTFTNYMLGADLVYDKKKGRWKIESKSEGNYPKIGNTPTSCT